jgi:hypothetical protein
MKAVADTLVVARSNLIERVSRRANSRCTRTYPFWAMHPRAVSLGAPVSRLALQAATSLFPC